MSIGATAPRQTRVTIRNDQPRRDVAGRIVDAHDGCLRWYAGRFYLYGIRYGDTDGFTGGNRPVCYSSPDLSQGSWTDHGPIVADPPEGLIFRSYVARSAATGRYVMFFKHHPGRVEAGAGKGAMVPPPNFAVAIADDPAGPFRVHTLRFETMHETMRHGDQDLFVDDDGTPYLVYAQWLADPEQPRFLVSVEQLTPDLLRSAGRTSGWIDHGCEAPSMFKRGGRYYVTCSRTCAFCPQGSGCRVYMAGQPLGPYRFTGNINREGRANDGPVIIPGQETHVATLPTPDGPAHIWMADLWGSSPDGVKGHDFQYWSSPLAFDDRGHIRSLAWEDAWSIDLALPGEGAT